MRPFKAIILCLTLLVIAPAIGCSSMKPGSVKSITPVTDRERVGSVYLLRGWIGIFSTGIDKLGKDINSAGVHAEVFQESQTWALSRAIAERYADQPRHEPIVLIGHSYGADGTIDIARQLAAHNVRVNLIVTLDPVTPAKVPANVDRVVNLYQSSALDALPFLRGIPLTPDEPGPVALENINIRTDRTDLLEPGLDHFNIEKKQKIQAEVIAQVLAVCEPRTAWSARQLARDIALASAITSPEPQGDNPQTMNDTATSLDQSNTNHIDDTDDTDQAADTQPDQDNHHTAIISIVNN